MPTVDERLRHVTLKVKRAKKHVTELEEGLRTFLKGNPYKVAAKRDPQTRKPIYYVSSANPVPDCLPLITGDIIQNLMSALDHLAYQIVCSDTVDQPPNPSKIYFPIGDDAAKYEAIKNGKIKGALKDTVDAIDALEPYKGGKGALIWELFTLNNREKHRLLITVGSQAAGFNITQHVANIHAKEIPPWMAAGLKSMNVFAVPTDVGFPLKEGFELLIGAPDEELNPEQQFSFTVAISEKGIVEGKPLLEAAHEFTNLVEGIVTALTPRLK